jgi:hypothetical protein
MGVAGKVVAASAAVALLLGSTPAAAQDPGSAMKLRELDIMLMVTALRCRFGPDGFQADYDRFSTSHIALMNEAAHSLQADLARRYGAKAAALELDRISVRMANRYGQGHPWLDCAGLKHVTAELAQEREPGAMVAAADTLLAGSPPANLALLARR